MQLLGQNARKDLLLRSTLLLENLDRQSKRHPLIAPNKLRSKRSKGETAWKIMGMNAGLSLKYTKNPQCE